MNVTFFYILLAVSMILGLIIEDRVRGNNQA